MAGAVVIPWRFPCSGGVAAKRTRVAPAAILNYALKEDRELVIEGRREEALDREPGEPRSSIVDNGIFIKEVLRKGGIFFDAGRKLLYVVCGEGRVDVVRQQDADHYSVAVTARTAPGARTGLLVPEERLLYVAAPATSTMGARLLTFRLR